MRLCSVFALLVTLALAGCGTKHGATPATTQAAPAATAQSGTSQAQAPSALQAEATAAATGDVPDNQVFLVFRNARVHYSLKYPEGWAQQGSGNTVTFRDKANVVRVVVQPGQLPSFAAARHAVLSSAGSARVQNATAVVLGSQHAVKVTYTTRSGADPVTGKRFTLVVDRYYLARGGRLAIVDLGTPQGVDNVDAYRLMIESFRWRK